MECCAEFCWLSLFILRERMKTGVLLFSNRDFDILDGWHFFFSTSSVIADPLTMAQLVQNGQMQFRNEIWGSPTNHIPVTSRHSIPVAWTAKGTLSNAAWSTWLWTQLFLAWNRPHTVTRRHKGCTTHGQKRKKWCRWTCWHTRGTRLSEKSVLKKTPGKVTVADEMK